MTPEQFNSELRDHLRERLPRHAAVIKSAVFGEDPTQLQRIVNDHPALLAENGLLEWSEVPRLNKVILAIYRNEPFEAYALEFGRDISVDRRAVDTFSKMFLQPDGVDDEDFIYVYHRYMLDDRFIGGGLGLLLKDQNFRTAMDLEDDVTTETYMLRARQFAGQARTYAEFREYAHQYGYFGTMACTWALACAAVAVAAFAVAVVWAVAYIIACANSVTTCSASGVMSGRASDLLPPQATEPTAMCINDAERTAWLVVRGDLGYRRIPLLPGQSSLDLGLSDPEAVIIGGGDNPLDKVHTPLHGVRTKGCYLLARVQGTPGIITLRQRGDCVVIACNDIQREADADGWAGYSYRGASEEVGPPSDDRFTMGGIAAVVPIGFDYTAYTQGVVGAERYYRALVTASTFRMLLGDTTSHGA